MELNQQTENKLYHANNFYIIVLHHMKMQMKIGVWLKFYGVMTA